MGRSRWSAARGGKVDARHDTSFGMRIKPLAKTIMQVSPYLPVPFLALGCKSDLRTGWNAKSDAGSATANGDAGFTITQREAGAAGAEAADGLTHLRQ